MEVLELLLERMDRSFFSKVFPKTYASAYELALFEEHELLPLQVISDDLALYANKVGGRAGDT